MYYIIIVSNLLSSHLLRERSLNYYWPKFIKITVEVEKQKNKLGTMERLVALHQKKESFTGNDKK